MSEHLRERTQLLLARTILIALGVGFLAGLIVGLLIGMR